MRPLLLVLVAALFVVHCRHRPDIFQDDLPLEQAFSAAKKAYSPRHILDPSTLTLADQTLYTLFDGAADLLNTFHSLARLEGCSKEREVLQERVGVLRKNCPEEFEEVAVGMTESLKRLAGAKLENDPEALNTYRKAVELQERVALYVPYLPVMTPYHFGMVAVGVVGVIVLTVLLALCR